MVIALATLNMSNTHHRLSSSEERTAHNREVTGSTPVGGIHHLRVYQNPPPLSLQQQFAGMAQRLARGAHNPEVTRSKRVAGIYPLPALQKHGVMLT